MIFSVSQFPERDGDLRNYGNEALEVVKEYFGKERSSADGSSGVEHTVRERIQHAKPNQNKRVLMIK